MNKPISTHMHGYIDYAYAGALLALPFALGWRNRAKNLAITNGLATLGVSLLTNYECGALRVLPMKAHLAMDAVGGATLAALPFIMDEDNPAAVACAVGMGLFDIAAAPLTDTTDVESSTSQSMFDEEDDSMARQWRVGSRAQQSGMNVPAVTGL